MKTENNTNLMQILNDYAGGHRHLITAGRILAAVSALMGLVPFYDLWKIIRIAVNGEDLIQIRGVAWQAVGITVAALLVYIIALFCTHIAAFRVQANMRSRLMRRILTLPLGVFDEDGTARSVVLSMNRPQRPRHLLPIICRIKQLLPPHRSDCSFCWRYLTGKSD